MSVFIIYVDSFPDALRPINNIHDNLKQIASVGIAPQMRRGKQARVANMLEIL